MWLSPVSRFHSSETVKLKSWRVSSSTNILGSFVAPLSHSRAAGIRDLTAQACASSTGIAHVSTRGFATGMHHWPAPWSRKPVLRRVAWHPLGPPRGQTPWGTPVARRARQAAEQRRLRSVTTPHCPPRGGPHGSHDQEVSGRHHDPPVHDRYARGGARGSACAPRRHALPGEGAGRRSVAGRAAGDDAGTRALLADGVRLAHVRGPAEGPTARTGRDRPAGDA